MPRFPNRLNEACDEFTTDSHVHAHDLGRVPCTECGWLFQEHPANKPGKSK